MSAALVVDDKPENLYLLQALLQGHGFTVACAKDGTEALALARTSPPDIIVSDILMPGMDGFALCREWRRDATLRHIPFVVYTATYRDPRDEKLALDMGADCFLLKPLEPEVLLARIQEVLAASRSGGTDAVRETTAGEEVVMREYNQALVRKLEDKLDELEEALRERDEGEYRLDHLNRVLAAIRSVNQLIVREKQADRLIQSACKVLTSTHGFEAAWIVVQDGEGAEQLAAQQGYDSELFARFLAAIRGGEWPLCGNALDPSAGRTVLANRGNSCGSCLLAQQHPDLSHVTVRLQHGGDCLGCLCVSVAAEFAGTEEESALIEEVGGDLAFALHAIRTERARRESEAALATIFDSVRDGVLLADATTRRFLRSNSAICGMLGYSKEEIRGLGVRDIHPPEHQEHVFAEFDRQLRGDNALSVDIPVQRKDGSVFLADIHSSVVELGERQCVLGVFRDITERKQAEEERNELQAQLDQAQKMESIGRLAGGVAHDFNNMLSVILGHVELVLERISPEQPLFDDLTEIQSAARRSADLTRQLLAFARKQTVSPRVLDLDSTVEGMLKMLRRLIGEDLDLAWIPGRNLWPVRVDPSQIDQILANLCVNARDAITGPGKVTIETSNVKLDEAYCAGHPGYVPGSYVLLAVSDDGCGMDKETLARVFEPFFTTKEVGRGTGLGLATVYGIVKQNNGFINVYSEPGHGTTFRMYLPRHTGTGAGQQPEVAEEPVGRGQEVILLVEDEAALLRMGTSMLERQGYTVLAASTPGEALRLASAHPGEVELLMTDVVMPEMDGRELASQIRSLYPQIKVLFMSGYMANTLAHRRILEEGEHFVGKPFTMSELWAKVRKALADGR